MANNQQPLELKKPEMILKLVLTDNQIIESKTNRYTEKDLRDKFAHAADTQEPIEWYGADENDEPVFCMLLQPKSLLGLLILDFASYVKHQQRLRGAQSNPRPAGLVIPR